MLTLTDLNECFDQAIEGGSRYIGVKIAVGLSKEEVIINPTANFKEKQAYYNQAYSENLRHKYAGDEDIRITGFTYGDSFAEIEGNLELYSITGNLN